MSLPVDSPKNEVGLGVREIVNPNQTNRHQQTKKEGQA